MALNTICQPSRTTRQEIIETAHVSATPTPDPTPPPTPPTGLEIVDGP